MLSDIERMKLNSLKEVSAYGIMEIKSKLQLDSLNSMKETEDDEPGVRFDLVSQCLLLETVKDFVVSFRPEPTKLPPTLATLNSAGGSLASLIISPAPSASASASASASPVVEKAGSGKSLTDSASKVPPAAAPVVVPAATPTPAPATIDPQEWAKLAALKKAMARANATLSIASPFTINRFMCADACLSA